MRKIEHTRTESLHVCEFSVLLYPAPGSAESAVAFRGWCHRPTPVLCCPGGGSYYLLRFRCNFSKICKDTHMPRQCGLITVEQPSVTPRRRSTHIWYAPDGLFVFVLGLKRRILASLTTTTQFRQHQTIRRRLYDPGRGDLRPDIPRLPNLPAPFSSWPCAPIARQHGRRRVCRFAPRAGLVLSRRHVRG